MTWTATIYRVDDTARAERYGIEPLALGATWGLWASLRSRLPGLYARGWEAWLVGEGWTMQLSLWSRMAPATRGGVDSIQVEVAGEGDPLGVLVALCRERGWCLFDDESGCFVDLDDPAGSSWEGRSPEPPGAAPRRSLSLLPSLRRSWRELVLYDLEGAPTRDGELFRRYPLGRAEDIRERITLALPQTRWSGRRGRADADGTAMLVHLKDAGLVDTLRIFADGLRTREWVEQLCLANGWSAWEPARKEFLFLHATSEEALAADLEASWPENVIPLFGR